MSTIASELRELRRQNVRLHRRLAQQRMPGKVVQRDPATRRVRLELGVDPATSEPVLSPWVRVQSGSAGAMKVFSLPTIGEQMYLESPSGSVGADSMATFGAFDDDHPAPAGDPEEMVFERGSARIGVMGDRIRINLGGDTAVTLTPGKAVVEASGSSTTLESGKASVTAAAIELNGPTKVTGGLQVQGGGVTHDGKNIGKTHVHVNAGGVGNSGVPA